MSDDKKRTDSKETEDMKRKASHSDPESEGEERSPCPSCPICTPSTEVNVKVSIVVTSASALEQPGPSGHQIIRVGERGPRGRGRGPPRAPARTQQDVPPTLVLPEAAQVTVPCQNPGAPTLTTTSPPTYMVSYIDCPIHPTWSLLFIGISTEQNPETAEEDCIVYLINIGAEKELPYYLGCPEEKNNTIWLLLNESNEDVTPVETEIATESPDNSLHCFKGEEKDDVQADSADVSNLCCYLAQERCEICSLVIDIQHLALLEEEGSDLIWLTPHEKKEDDGETSVKTECTEEDHDISLPSGDAEDDFKTDSDFVSEVCCHMVEEQCEICSLANSLNQLSIGGMDNDSESSSEVSQENRDALQPSFQTNRDVTLPDSDIVSSTHFPDLPQQQAENPPPVITTQNYELPPETVTIESPYILSLIYSNTVALNELLESRVNALDMLASVALEHGLQNNQSTTS